MSYTDDRIFLIECMVKAGYTQNSARQWLNTFVDRANTRALEDSDHPAYRELADEVDKVIHTVADPDEWDGDDSELYILTIFLEWLPDLIKHDDAEKIRNMYPVGTTGELTASKIADTIDPFQLHDGTWVRKSDGREVPWNVAKAPEEGDHT